MEPNYEVANNKQQEVNVLLRTSLIKMGIEPDSTDDFINTTLTPSILVRPPKTPIPVQGSAEKPTRVKTEKPGNIKLSINTLIDQIVKTHPPGMPNKREPWLGIFAFIELLRQVSDLQDVNLSENDAMVIWCMWFVRGRRTNTTSGKDLLTKINTHLVRYDRSALTEAELETSLKNLEDISAIRQSKNTADCWYLVGWVKRTYQ
ncbi:hypothetical protein [uncultured Paraglaciecola sp.]|uniref:hypothetical protein n=1 Tax=uncultured Paraglaciecola sp. TaxID=1765024 RepID=UPI0030DCE4F5|tara:strand:+ start:969 stop:1580 length:612 start_codon:yes stop_codon:yes gene_type:complete